MSSDDVQAAFPKGLPGEEYLLNCQGASLDKRNDLRPVFARIAALALQTISRQTEIRFPSAVIQSEKMYFSGKVPYVIPRNWPVKQILQGYDGASTQGLRIGSEQEVVQGRAQLAIGQDGGTIAIGAGVCSRYLFVTYRAGMDELPLDLLEVFAELGSLMWKESGRIGTTSDKFKDAEVRFTRSLPDWAQKTLNTYRRVAAFV